MNKRKILDRIELLTDVFAYSLIYQRFLSDSKRICLTQERASWLSVLDNRTEKPRYIIPNHLEIEVQKVYQKIKVTNWIKPDYEPF